MNDSALTRFFGVVVRPRTRLGIVFHLLAFPLGLVYFVFLVTGLSVGVSLVVIWVGIPILLVVAGAWWLLAAFERVQARYLLAAEIRSAPRPWERADGVWGKLKAHFGSGSTWRDLAYLITKLASAPCRSACWWCWAPSSAAFWPRRSRRVRRADRQRHVGAAALVRHPRACRLGPSPSSCRCT